MYNRKISLCLTNFNRYKETLEAFIQIANDDRISEIVISDDKSDIEIYRQLELAVSFCPKVRLYRNEVNQDCYMNKRQAVSLASNEWVIIFDSDNIISTDFIDKLYSISEWDSKVAYMAAWAQPLFDYRPYSWITFSKRNIAEYIDKPMVETCCNCMNYFVNRYEYLDIWKGDINPYTYDSLYQNYNWFAAGNSMLVVGGMFYTHVVHEQSHYRLNVHKSGNLREEIVSKIKELR